MLNRRSFLQAPAALANATSTAKQQHRGQFLLGRWMVNSADLHIKDAQTAFIRGMQHESPQIKFPAGFPDRGDPVMVNIGWDVCHQRGAGRHRTLAKMVLRVKPIASLTHDSEIHVVTTPQGVLDGERFRLLRPTALHTTNVDCHQREWWIVRVTNESRALLQDALTLPVAEPIAPQLFDYEPLDLDALMSEKEPSMRLPHNNAL